MKNYRVAYIYADGDIQPGLYNYWTLRGATKVAKRLTNATKALETGGVFDQFILELVGGSREWFAVHKDELELLQDAAQTMKAQKAQPEK